MLLTLRGVENRVVEVVAVVTRHDDVAVLRHANDRDARVLDRGDDGAVGAENLGYVRVDRAPVRDDSDGAPDMFLGEGVDDRHHSAPQPLVGLTAGYAGPAACL